MPFTPFIPFAERVTDLQSKGRYRSLQSCAGLDVSSNDYLGFKDHPVLQAAAIEAVGRGVGLGSGGSRLLRGNAAEHDTLEAFAADHYGFESALYFANGFQANQAVLGALPGRGDIVLYDDLVHASMRDALHRHTAKSFKVAHNDVHGFERALQKYSDGARQIYIAVESLYSMDGDFAPLEALQDLALRYDAILIVDEAHSTGVYGDDGQGLCTELSRDNLIVIHTCGKALGVAGGLVCAPLVIVEYLVNVARAFIYSTAPPPLQAYLTHRAIELSASVDGRKARAHLSELRGYAQSRLGGAGSQILPVILGDDESAVRAAQTLQDDGFDVRAIRPPTVPEGSARLRLSLNAKLSKADLEAVIKRAQMLM